MALLDPNKKNQVFADVAASTLVLADDGLWRALAKLLSREFNTNRDPALGAEADLVAALQSGIDLITTEFHDTTTATRKAAAKDDFDDFVELHGREIVADLLLDKAEVDGRLSGEHVIYRTVD